MSRITAALFCGLLLCCAPAAQAAEDPAAAFAALPFIDAPRISPDGLRLAALVAMQEQQLLAVLPVEGEGEPVFVRIGENEALLDWQWVNDAWLVMRLAGSVSIQGDLWRVTRAYGVRAADGKVVSLAKKDDGQNGAGLLWIASDGSPRILMAVQQSLYSSDEKYYPEVFEVDVSSGKRTSRVKPRMGVMDWYADSDGFVRMGIGYRDLSRTAQVYYRPPGGTFRTIDTANARKDESLMDLPALFLSEPGRALAFSSASGFIALHEFNLDTRELGPEVFSVPGYDIDSLVTDPTGKELLGVRYTDTRARTEWFEPVMSKAQRDLDAAFGPDGAAQIVSISGDGQRLVVHAGSGSDPGAYYVMNLGSRSLSRIGRVYPGLQDFDLAQVRTLRYPARDGLSIEAVLTLPAGREARGLPLIVMPHGGPAARDAESFDWWAQFLAHLGYAVIQPNYRGSSGYGEAFSASGEGQWGLAMQDDLLDAVDHLAAEGVADPGRVCIVGGSYGGYAALRALERDGLRWRCGISFAGVSDLAQMVRENASYLNAGALRDRQRQRSPDYDAVSPLHGAARFESPVLLVHGRRDLTVRFTHSSAMARALQSAGKPHRYVELPQGDHHLRRREDRLMLLREVAAFLSEHNPAGAPQATAHP